MVQNQDNENYYYDLIEKIEKVAEPGRLIIGGDFNFVINPSIDRHKSVYNNEKNHAVVSKYVETKELVDVWRVRNLDVKRFTWHRNKKYTASRIDMYLVEQNLNGYGCDCDIVPAVRTDHSAIMLEIKLFSVDRGPGF